MKIAINGFGRIGRNILRAIYESQRQREFEVIAINDLTPSKINAHLLQHDSTHGRFSSKVDYDDKHIYVEQGRIQFFQEREPSNLPWKELGIDIVFECTGYFRKRDKAQLHLDAGAKKVLVSAPSKQLDKTIVYGVNEHTLLQQDKLVSNASCTTNCLAHVAKAMNDAIGIESGLANTIHAYTNTQNLVDAYHKDMRRARAAASSMIPTSTGSAKAIGEVIPELDGVLDAVAVRVPNLNVSLLDLTVIAKNKCSVDELENVFDEYQKGREGVFEVNRQPLVSIDFNHHLASCVIDIEQTRVRGNLIKVQAWYDNEWAFSNRMLDTAFAMSKSMSS